MTAPDTADGLAAALELEEEGRTALQKHAAAVGARSRMGGYFFLAAVLFLPEMAATITPLVYAIPVQLLAYHTAVFMGTDVDQPRNLAKSVTVE